MSLGFDAAHRNPTLTPERRSNPRRRSRRLDLDQGSVANSIYTQRTGQQPTIRGASMSYTPELVTELEVLRQFNLENLQEGLKVHHDASPSTIAAFERLHAKGLITQADGGYLTSLGRDAAEQAQTLLTILTETASA